MRKIVITTFSDKITAVTFEEGRPSLINVYDKNDSDKETALLGNVYICRVQNVVKISIPHLWRLQRMLYAIIRLMITHSIIFKPEKYR